MQQAASDRHGGVATGHPHHADPRAGRGGAVASAWLSISLVPSRAHADRPDPPVRGSRSRALARPIDNTGMVDQELLARNEYLAAENRILKTQSKGRLQLSDAERATLGEIGHRLGRRKILDLTLRAPPAALASTDGKRAVERRKEPHHNSGSDHRYDRDHGKENRVFKGSHSHPRPQSAGSRQMLRFNSGHQNRKLRPAKWVIVHFAVLQSRAAQVSFGSFAPISARLT
jgi:hypothetical protein